MNDTQSRLELLQQAKTIAVVGLSPKTDRASHQVALYMQQHGYKIIPVHPKATEILGETCYPNILAVPQPVDIVNLFIRSENVGPIVHDAITLQPKAIWMQLGIENQAAAAEASAAGIQVIMDLCIKIEHARLLGE